MRPISKLPYALFALLLLLIFTTANALAANPGGIVTVAGGFTGDGGLATDAIVNNPYSVAIDGAGNVFIAEQGFSRIRKVSVSSGIITTVAGKGYSEYSGDGGPATAAGLYDAVGIAVDSAGNLYISDAEHIRKIDGTTGIITTVVADNGCMGCIGFSGDGGPAVSAQLYEASGIAVDSTGNLYIADAGNNRIRKVNVSTGIITTVAGNGAAGFSGDGGVAIDASLGHPSGVSVDSAGNLYIADSYNRRIRKVAAETGIITTVAGNGSLTYSGDNGPATSAGISTLYDVSVDSSGNLFIIGGVRIRKVDAVTGIINTVAGNGIAGYSGDNGLATAAKISTSHGVSVDNSGNLYIADSSNNRIRKVAADTGIIATVAGNGTAGYSGDNGLAAAASALFSPSGVSIDASGNLYIADQNNNRIRKVAVNTGIITTVAGNGTPGYSGDNGLAIAASLYNPSSVSVDTLGNIYIADYINQCIRKVTASTGIITTVAGNGIASFSGDDGQATAASLNNPSSVSVDTVGNIYIADYVNHRIRKVAASTGTITTVAGNGTPGFGGDDGPATAARLRYPYGISVDSSGNLYIADTNNNRIRKVAADTGIITTVAGNGTAGYSGDNGLATAANLSNPSSVSVDTVGNIYIADNVNHRIRKVAASTGIITTVAGNGIPGFSGDGGTAISASLYNPSGVSVDSSGNLYIADSFNNRVRKVIKPTYTTAAISYAPAGPYAPGTSVTITAAFNDLIADATPPQIALSGANTVAATAMTKVDYKTYRYVHTVQAGSGTVNVTIPGGSDINGVTLAATPSSGESFVITVDISTYTVTFNANGGSGSMAPQTADIATNLTANSFTRSPAYAFSGWNTAANGTGTAYADQASYPFTSDVTLYAQWTGLPTLTVIKAGTGAGTVTLSSRSLTWNGNTGTVTPPNPPVGTYETLTATPDTGSTFTGWNGGGCSGTGTCVTTHGFSTVVTATFDVATFTVTPSAGSGGSLSPDTAQSVAYNGITSFTIVPDSGYYIDTVSGCGGSLDGDVYTIAPASADCTVAVTFTDLAPGYIRTIAGGGVGDGGPATAGLLVNPYGLVRDAAGNIFVADYSDHRVRKVSAVDGTITTIAGTGQPGYSGDDGPATSAQLKNPYAVAVDAAGNVYISDSNNHRIRKVDIDGIITTVAGNGSNNRAYGTGDGGSALLAPVGSPKGLTIDATGNLFVVDYVSVGVRKINAVDGIISTVAGNMTTTYSGDGGPATAAGFSCPDGLTIDSTGNLYISELCGTARVRKVTAATGIIDTVAGGGTGGDGGLATAAVLSYPRDITVDTVGNLYIANWNSQSVRKVDTSGIISTVPGLINPSGVTVDKFGNLYMSDRSSNPLIVKLPAGSSTPVTLAGGGVSVGDGNLATLAGLTSPAGIVRDNQGNLYIADSSQRQIRKINAADGTISTVAGTGASGSSGDGGPATAATFTTLVGVAVDAAGNLYVVDRDANRVRKINAANGTISTLISSLPWPSAVTATVDAAGYLYVVANYNSQVLKVDTATGISTVVAGTGTIGYSGDGGPATAAQIYPSAIALDGSGNLYLADYHRIRRVSAADGTITTVAGNGSASYSGDGDLATAAGVYQPSAVAVDSAGNIYIGDYYNKRIRWVSAADGKIRTAVGPGTPGVMGDGGPAIAAEILLATQSTLLFDPRGNLYIPDAGNHRVRMVRAGFLDVTPPVSPPPYGTREPSWLPYTFGTWSSEQVFVWINARKVFGCVDTTDTCTPQEDDNSWYIDSPAYVRYYVADAAGNRDPEIHSVRVLVDTVAPVAQISAPSVAGTVSGPVSFTVSYDDANLAGITLGPENITLNTTGTATGTVFVEGASGNTRTVTISNITGSGSIGISIAAGTASDMASNQAPGAGPSSSFAVVPPVHTVTFDSNGGSAVASQTVNYNTIAAVPTPPTKTGYTFAGWYREAELTNLWTFASDTVTTDTTLYAKWTINSYSVTPSAGSGGSLSPEETQTVFYNQPATFTVSPNVGYRVNTITGCGVDLEGTTMNGNSFMTAPVTADCTVTATFTLLTYTVTFDLNGGTWEGGGELTQTITHGQAATAPEFTAPTGKVFSGWDATFGNITADTTVTVQYVDDTDNDGVADVADAFPLDAAASVDVDADGYPEAWNPGKTDADTTTGLLLAWADFDQDGLSNAVEGHDGTDPRISNLTLTDTDRDGLPDSYESTFGLDPLAANTPLSDLDGDGYRDSAEYLYGLDPLQDDSLSADSDADGMRDTIETALGLDPQTDDRFTDLDSDGFVNLDELRLGTLPRIANSELPDSDHDGLPDPAEILAGTDPAVDSRLTDRDSDGLTDRIEYANATLALAEPLDDQDGDHLPYLYEVTHGFDPNVAQARTLDTDGDGFADLLEYRLGLDPLSDNRLDADSDNDGLGDPLETLVALNPNDPADVEGDPDGDSLPSLAEIALGTSPQLNNAQLPDSDSDSLPDSVEILAGTDPLTDNQDSDSDGDGLGDLLEYLYGTLGAVNAALVDQDSDTLPDLYERSYGLDPTIGNGSSDSDNDGSPDLEEYQVGTLPKNPDTDGDDLEDGEDAAPFDPLAGDVTPPTVTGFTLPATATSRTVAIGELSASDNLRVTGYLLTTAATPPSALALGWSATLPTSFTFASGGSKVLYAWARDAAGNVSASRSATVVITLPLGAAPATLTVPATDADGSYTVTWSASTTSAAGYILEEATNSAFTLGLRQAYSGTGLSAAITGRSSGTTYYYRIRSKATADYQASAWKIAGNACKIDLRLPATLTVPTGDADGAYNVTWSASPTAGVTYILQEATDSAFTLGLRTAYSGLDLTAPISGRLTGKTYYYRIKTTKTGYTASSWKAATSGCLVKFPCVAPATLTVPATDADGAYSVTWSASTIAGVTYTLQEATNITFTSGLRTAYTGTALQANIAGRVKGTKYFYRIKASKTNYSDSPWKAAANGCGIACAVPGALTIPAADADGSYPIKWLASPTPGVTYTLQEATNSTFSVGVVTAYTGTALQADLSGRITGKTYYYRVRASKTGVPVSDWKVGGVGCAVPGTAATVAPAAVTVPATDLDGAYNVTWNASTTTGVTYTVQEATNATFTANLRTAYTGTGLTVPIAGRTAGQTYYYRVRAMKAGLKDSGWKTAVNGCAVGG